MLEGAARVYERLAAVRLAAAHWRTDIALAAVEGRITLPGGS